MFWLFRHCRFLSTLSLRRATVLVLCSSGGAFDFYPRSPCGERRAARITPTASRNFYPRSPCGERQQAQGLKIPPLRISIHALLAESDPPAGERLRSTLISIHALLAESDRSKPLSRQRPSKFLSTLSLRRATHGDSLQKQVLAFLSTLSLRRATKRRIGTKTP